MDPEVTAMVTYRERQIRCMHSAFCPGSGSSWNHGGRGWKKGYQTPRMLTLPRGLESLAKAHNGKQASASCSPGLTELEGGGRSHHVPSLWEAWGSSENPYPEISLDSIFRGIWELHREGLKPNSL